MAYTENEVSISIGEIVSESYKELREISDDELIIKYDNHAKTTFVGTRHYLDELARRESVAINQSMLHFTKWITIMTFVMLLFTVTNVLIAVLM